MAADGGDSAEFTIRLVNQVMAPARQIKQTLGEVDRAFRTVQKTMAAPSPKRGPLSDWDRMMAGAKRSQASDFARQQAAVAKATAAANLKQARAAEIATKKQAAMKSQLAQFHADHGLSTLIAGGGAELAVGATAAIAAAGVAAAAAIGYLGFKFAEASVEAAMFAQKSELAIGFLTNSGAQAAIQLDAVRHMAQGLGLDVNETVRSFERLLAMQFSVGKSKDLIKMASDMQAIGANAEEVQRILYAISEIKSMGTLQKRQERMLQMAGISGELIDAALMKRGGFKDHGALDTARKKNKIGADVAIDAIMEAVMHKTHEAKLGQAGAAFAQTTLAGMRQSLESGIENLYIDAGKRILPGLTDLAKLAADGIKTLSNDPQIAALGDYLVNEFDIFVMWVKANWPEIKTDLVNGAEAMAKSIRFVVGAFDTATPQGMLLEGVLITIATALGIVAIAGFTLMAPLYLLVAAIGAVVYAVVKGVEWISDKLSALNAWLGGGKGATAATTATGSALPLDPWAKIPALSLPAANDTTGAIQGVTAAGGIQALQSMDSKTERGQESGGSPVHIGSLAVNVQSPEDSDPQHFGAKVSQAVHSELTKLMRQAS